MRLMQAILLVTLICFMSPEAVGQPPTKKVYTGKQLTVARDAFKDYRFSDKEIGELFARDNTKVAAIVLEIWRPGGEVAEIKVLVGYQKEKDLKSLKTLTRKDNDFKTVVERLKLKG
ncbi:MAG: hypothetical protein L0215_24675 [Gemmataceae bacterium]|nr:hypothetical protein [Gemmataceae bacterium]